MKTNVNHFFLKIQFTKNISNCDQEANYWGFATKRFFKSSIFLLKKTVCEADYRGLGQLQLKEKSYFLMKKYRVIQLHVVK